MTYPMTWRRCLPVAAAMLVVCSGWAASAAAGSATGKPVLRIGGNFARTSPDPSKDASSFGANYQYEPIVVNNGDGTYGPGLATSWRYLKAPPRSGLVNKGFEFTLRHDARFSDGRPVTAQAVKAWFEYFLRGNGPYLSALGTGPSFETVGKWTVRIHLTSPNPQILFALGGNWGFVNSPAAVANPTLFATGSYGAGPYELDRSQTVEGDHYTFVPNPYYYDKSKVKWSKIVYRVIGTSTSILQALQAGQIDVAGGDRATAAAAAGSGLKVLQAPGGTLLFVLDAAGGKLKALADLRVRQALNYAVDRKTITAALLGKFASPTSAWVTSDGFDRKYADYYPYNPAKARSLLAEAGYPNGFTVDPVGSFGFASDGTPMAQAVAKYLAAVGVTLQIKSDATIGDYIQDLVVDQTPMVWWGPTLQTTSFWYVTAWKPGSALNHLGGGWKDKTLFDLWVKGSRAADPKPYWKQMIVRLTTQAYYLPIGQEFQLEYVNAKKVKGVALTGYGLSPITKWAPA